MKTIFKIFKRIIFSFLVLYGFNLILMPLDIIIPINIITMSIISLFGITSLFSLVTILLVIF